MAGLAEPCSPEHLSRSCNSAELTAVEFVVPVLRDVLKRELKDFRDLKPLHDSLAARLDAASQENAAQFETLREIVKRLSTSLRDKAEVTEVMNLVEQQCSDRLDNLETFCTGLGARIDSVREECREGNISLAQARPKEASSPGGPSFGSRPTKVQATEGYYDEATLSRISSVKRFNIDTGDDPPRDGTSELHLMRYECELEQMRCMIFEGQSATEQLRATILREHETGVTERARLDGLQTSLADNIVTLSRTHASVGERLQQMQEKLDNLNNTMQEKLHSSSTEAIVKESATKSLEALRHHHSCVEALRQRLENMDASLKAEHALICERQDSMENMISEEHRRIWLAMETHLGKATLSVITAPLKLGQHQQAGNTCGTAAVAATPLPPLSSPQPTPPRSLGTNGKLVPCSHMGSPQQSPRQSPRQIPWQSASVQAPVYGGGSGSSPHLQILAMSGESTPTTTNGGCGAVTPVCCTSPSPAASPTRGSATPTRGSASPTRSPASTRRGSAPPPHHASTAPRAVRGGSPMQPATLMSSSPPPASPRSPSRKQASRLSLTSVLASPGGSNHRSPVGSPVLPHRNIASRNRGGTPSNSSAVHRRRQQDHVSRPSWQFEDVGGSPRAKGQ